VKLFVLILIYCVCSAQFTFVVATDSLFCTLISLYMDSQNIKWNQSDITRCYTVSWRCGRGYSLGNPNLLCGCCI